MTREEAINECLKIQAFGISENQINAMELAISALSENKGEWIFDDECHEHGHCSKCGYGKVDLVDGKIHNFCPNCGADMRGGVKSFYDRMTEELGENWDIPTDMEGGE